MTEVASGEARSFKETWTLQEAPCGGPALFLPLSLCLSSSPYLSASTKGSRDKRSTTAPKFMCIRCHRPDQGLHSSASICSAVLCVAVQRTRRAPLRRCPSRLFSRKTEAPALKKGGRPGSIAMPMAGPAMPKSTNGCMLTRAAIDAT